MSDAEFAHISAERHFIEQALAQVRRDASRCTAARGAERSYYGAQLVLCAIVVFTIIFAIKEF